MWKYAALVSYVGTRYCGWQTQKGAASGPDPSIQETIQRTLVGIVSDERVSPVGSGRTDAGVHAAGQVVHFVVRTREWDADILKRALNSRLPGDIRVLDVKPVPIEFHAQRSATRKQYSYYFQQGPSPLPHLTPFSWWIRKRLDREAMQRAVDHLVGEHDFKPFQASGAKVGTSVRRILEGQIGWEPIVFPGSPHWDAEKFGLVRVRLVGTGFLKQMVRGIAGTLLQVGEGRREADCTRDILKSGDRSRVGQTAPGRALWLERVWYDQLDWSV